MRRPLLALIALTLVAAACGDDAATTTTTVATTTTTVAATTTTTTVAETTTSAPTTTTTAAAFPVTVLGATVETEPQAIVSLSATHTEILYAVGAGERVVATDLFSDFPAAAADTEKIDSFSLNVEAVADLDPDLVLLAFDPGDAVDGFAALGIPAVLFPAPTDLDAAFEQWLQVGALTGTTATAEGLVEAARAEIADIQADLPRPDQAPTYYHELDPTLFTVTSETFVGAVYAAAGMENVADPADESGFGYPQLSAEFLLETDPDYVFLADSLCCDVTPASFAERPALGALTAVEEGRVIPLDDSVASRWGPRLVDFLRTVVVAVYPTAFGE